MSLTDAQKTIAAAVFIAATAVGGYRYFMPRSEAAEQVASAKAEVQKTVDQLRAELLLSRAKQLNAKEAKEGLTSDEKLERELTLAQIKAIQAEQVKK